MKIRATRLTLALMLVLTVAPVALAQDSLHDWSVVQALTRGTELIVETKAAETIKVKLRDVADTTLNFSREGKMVALDQQQIQRIYLKDKRSRTSSALIGAAKGAYAGARIAGGGRYSYWYAPKRYLLGGAVVGAVIEGRNRKGQLIYESK